MEPSVRQLMLLLQHGQSQRALEANTAWTCAACHTCLVRCPRGIEVPKVFEAVRLLALRANEDLITIGAIPKETIAGAPQIAMVSTFRKLTA
jgi:heterodisulfide reductase subunit C